MTDTSTDNTDTIEQPSKSQVKRDMLALRKFGAQLVELSTDQLKKIDLPENLLNAIYEAQSINSREGKRRQINYVGKLLRRADYATINTQYKALKHGSKEQTQSMHQIEALRDLLINNDQALTELLTSYPNANIQQLRSLIRAARRENLENQALGENSDKQPKRRHYRSLYQALQNIIMESK